MSILSILYLSNFEIKFIMNLFIFLNNGDFQISWYPVFVNTRLSYNLNFVFFLEYVVEGEGAELVCDYQPTPGQFIDSIKWYLNSSEIYRIVPSLTTDRYQPEPWIKFYAFLYGLKVFFKLTLLCFLLKSHLIPLGVSKNIFLNTFPRQTEIIEELRYLKTLYLI